MTSRSLIKKWNTLFILLYVEKKEWVAYPTVYREENMAERMAKKLERDKNTVVEVHAIK